MGGKHQRFPNLTLFDLPVAQNGVDAIILLVELAGERHAAGGGDALAERAGGHIDAGDSLHIGMTLEHRMGLTQTLELFLIEKAAQSQNRIQRRSRMAFGKDETVAIGVLGIGGVDLHFFVVEIGQNIHAGKRAAGMAGFGQTDGLNGQHAALGCQDLQGEKFLVVHGTSSILFFNVSII